MKHNYEYEYENIILKPLELNDIEQLRLLRNKNSNYFIDKKFISKSDQLKWFYNYINNNEDIMFSVVRKDISNVTIGFISVYNIDNNCREAEVGRSLIDHDVVKVKGFGTMATIAICKFCFEILNIEKIIAFVLKNNEKALYIDKKIGFKIKSEKNDVYYLELTRGTLNG